MTAIVRVGVRLAILFAALAGTMACEVEKSPAGPSDQLATPAVQSLAISGTLSLQRPGDKGNLAVTATLADGTTKPVTWLAAWLFGSTAPFVTVSSGLVTAIGYGSGEITASYQGVSQSIPVRVAPDGAFLIEGRVTEGGQPVLQATVEAVSAAGTYSATTGALGGFFLPGAGAVTLRAYKFNYETTAVQVFVDRDDKVSLALTRKQEQQPLPEFGRYTLTFIASPSCALPAEVSRRTYGAQVLDARVYKEPWDLDVVLDGASFPTVWAEPGFIGRMDGATVRFTITDDVENSSYAFIEQVGPSSTLHFVGTAAAGTFNDQGIVATFDGSVVLRGTTVIECRAADHQLVFAR